MRVYLDNCCYNRPYDDQSQLLVSLEAHSKLFIQSLIREGKIELATSFVLTYENENNPHEERRNTISEFIAEYSTIYVSRKNKEKIEIDAKEIMATGVKLADASHVAAAIMSDCDWFLTTDKRLLKYKTDKITITDPLSFLRIIGDEYNDK